MSFLRYVSVLFGVHVPLWGHKCPFSDTRESLFGDTEVPFGVHFPFSGTKESFLRYTNVLFGGWSFLGYLKVPFRVQSILGYKGPFGTFKRTSTYPRIDHIPEKGLYSTFNSFFLLNKNWVENQSCFVYKYVRVYIRNNHKKGFKELLLNRENRPKIRKK